MPRRRSWLRIWLGPSPGCFRHSPRISRSRCSSISCRAAPIFGAAVAFGPAVAFKDGATTFGAAVAFRPAVAFIAFAAAATFGAAVLFRPAVAFVAFALDVWGIGFCVGFTVAAPARAFV